MRFEKTLCWQEKGRHYQIDAAINTSSLRLIARNTDARDYIQDWDDFIEGYSRQEVKALEEKLEKLDCAPTSAAGLGEVWLPFVPQGISPTVAWQMWVDSFQENALSIALEELSIPVADDHMGKRNRAQLICSYRGVISGSIFNSFSSAYELLLLLDGELRPSVKASRSQISNMPLELVVAIHGILNAWTIEPGNSPHISGWRTSLLPAWRKLRGTKLERWLKDNLHDYFERILGQFSQHTLSGDARTLNISGTWPESNNALQSFFVASMQDSYQMKVNYEEGQIITLSDKISEEDVRPYDLFPPMMFCNAATQLSRRYLCSEGGGFRRCITADHPYTVWLLKNAVALNEYYTRQFQQIVSVLRSAGSEHIIDTCNSVREQLLSLPERRGIDMAICPQLSQDDFWAPEDKSVSISDLDFT